MKTAENKMISKSYSYLLLVPGMLIYGIIFVLPTMGSFYFFTSPARTSDTLSMEVPPSPPLLGW